ncbi:MAG: helix-turn-helix domain-containing protein [Puniceicoccaceae bacterium]
MQRQNILNAARRAFRERGFHAATMSLIAEYAGVSQGLAYRYFKNKDAITEAIAIEEQKRLQIFVSGLKDFDAIIAAVVNHVKSLGTDEHDPQKDTILEIELNSEANRNPAIDAIIREWDSKDEALFKSCLTHCYAQQGRTLSDKEIEAKIFLIRVIFDGFAVRSRMVPEIMNDSLLSELERVFREIFEI